MAELFETFDDDGDPLGLVERALVHRRGLWHKSSHVYLYDTAGRLYVQERAAHKDLYAGMLDYSVGEHLVPGETHEAGALRGLREELGVTGVPLEPLGAPFAERYEDHRLGVRDFEIQQAFRGVYEGAIRLDPQEVASVMRLSIGELRDLLNEQPSRFTPWFARAVSDLIAMTG